MIQKITLLTLSTVHNLPFKIKKTVKLVDVFHKKFFFFNMFTSWLNMVILNQTELELIPTQSIHIHIHTQTQVTNRYFVRLALYFCCLTIWRKSIMNFQYLPGCCQQKQEGVCTRAHSHIRKHTSLNHYVRLC